MYILNIDYNIENSSLNPHALGSKHASCYPLIQRNKGRRLRINSKYYSNASFKPIHFEGNGILLRGEDH